MKVIKKELPNGLIIVFIPMAKTSMISMGFFIRAGGRNEKDDQLGIAHFLEHMLFKGTTHRTADQLYHTLDGMGAVYNAVTTYQYTSYYIYGHMDDTKKILDILLDMYVNPVFNSDEIKKERKVIIEEMRVRGDMLINKLYKLLYETYFKNTSLARPLVGTEQTIMNLKRKDFVEFKNTFYVPENTVFVIAGNFNPVPLYPILEKILKPLKNLDIPQMDFSQEDEIILKNMDRQDQPFVHVKKNPYVHQVYSMISFPLFDRYDEYYREIEVIIHLLTSGSSSRISHALREENGITYSSSCDIVEYNGLGVFIIYIIMHPVEFLKGLKIVFNVLKDLKKKLISEEEYHKVLKFIRNESSFSESNPLNLLNNFGLGYLFNKNYKISSASVESIVKSYKSIKREDIISVAKKIFKEEKLNLFIYGNTDVTNYDFINL